MYGLKEQVLSSDLHPIIYDGSDDVDSFSIMAAMAIVRQMLGKSQVFINTHISTPYMAKGMWTPDNDRCMFLLNFLFQNTHFI